MIKTLKRLFIENLAVIERAEIEFDSRLNIFTGETGAGKSILIGGINAILGKRIYRDIVRSGTDKASVYAVFDDIPKRAEDLLLENGFSLEDELIISREITKDGKSSSRINSKPASLAVVKEVGELLVNIHGQHDSQLLLDPESHLELLDSYAESRPLIEDYLGSFKELQATARSIKELRQLETKSSARTEYLREIIEDVAPLNLKENEDEELEARFRLLENSVSIIEAIGRAITSLTGDDAGDSFLSATELTSSAYSELEAYSELLPGLSDYSKRLMDAGIELSDIAHELSSLKASLDIDDNEYQRLSLRRSELLKLKRKYRLDINEIIKLYNDASQELTLSESFEDRISELEGKKSRLLLEVTKKAESLSQFRKKACERFSSEVSSELSFLNMPDVRIAFDIQQGKLTHDGMDKLELLISANKGESPKPISKIASGGELSRIMLAIKAVLADRDSIDTMIFDEIDSGVSGRAAQKIGIKLKELSGQHQIICVTHLAQIAIMADRHLLIEKSSEDGKTSTTVKPLAFEDRKYEIARILGGDNITDTVLMDAEEQLRNVMKGDPK